MFYISNSELTQGFHQIKKNKKKRKKARVSRNL